MTQPKTRAPLDKLQSSGSPVDRLLAGYAALNKRYERMGDQAAGLQKQLDEVRANLDIVEASMASDQHRRLQ